MLWLQLVGLIGVSHSGGSEAGSNTDYFTSQVVEQQVQLDDIEVWARRGAARVPPESELDGGVIDALGAWDIGEVLKRLSETTVVGDEPMVIINGKRVANAGVFSGFPPDALVRVEILPIEAAAIYGGTPGQRVVNLVLQQRFSSYDGRLAGSRPTQGGTSSLSGDLRRSAILGENTYQVGFRAGRDTALRAEERDRHMPTNTLGAGAVTLRPKSDVISANAVLTRSLGEWSGVFSLNGQIKETSSTVSIEGSLLENHRRNESLSGSVGLTGAVYGWEIQANLNGQASSSRDDGFNDMRNETQSLSLTASANRTLADMSTGPLIANVSSILRGSRSITDRVAHRTTTTDQMHEARASLAIPLMRADEISGMGRLFGDTQANIGASVLETRGGGGGELSGGLVWIPRKGLRLNAVWSTSNDSVSEVQRSEPLYYDTPKVTFDFLAGEAVEIIPIRGGNSDLRSPRSERMSLTASLGPFSSWNWSGSFGFQRAETVGGIGTIPDITEDVEAAFPERFHRDPTGRLISIDYRPLNLNSSLAESLSTSLNFNLPQPMGPSAGEATLLRVALNYNVNLTNTVSLLSSQPNLDRLKGDGGGVAEQEARIAIDASRGRWGVNASAWWQDGYRTRRISGTDGSGDLLIEPLVMVNLKLSFQMRSLAPRISREGENKPQRRRSNGLQLNLEVENLFDERPSAHLGDGSPALGYGRDIQDPIGRTVRLTLQRRF